MKKILIISLEWARTSERDTLEFHILFRAAASFVTPPTALGVFIRF